MPAHARKSPANVVDGDGPPKESVRWACRRQHQAKRSRAAWGGRTLKTPEPEPQVDESTELALVLMRRQKS